MTTVIFDMGAVLIDWNPRHLYRSVFAEQAEMEHFLEEICPPDWNVAMDAGRPMDEALAERQALFPDHHDTIQLWKDRWPEMMAGSIPGSVSLLRELYEAGVPLYGLTNFSAETWPYAEKRFGFLRWFNDILVSGAEKMIKPDAGIYRALLARNSLKAEQCLFIDDSPKNVEGAQAVGLQAHHFTSVDSLRDDLERHGLLTPAFSSKVFS
ncbi:HAD family hydrolase [Rhodovibrionaceae bacterium A322]